MAEQKAPSPANRARIQQNVISVFCVLAAIMVFVWLILSSVSLETDTGDSSSNSADESSSVISADKNKEDVVKNDDSSSDDSSAPQPVTKDSDDFADACFVGDSRTVGLSMNSGKPLATFYCATGLNVSSALDEKNITLDNGNMGNVSDALAQHQFSRVYVMFGINEIGWPYVENFQAEYEELINAIKEKQPDAKIYIQSIIPITASKEAEGEPWTNENVKRFNVAVKAAADNCGVEFLDVGSALADANGYLPEEASTDGVHLVKEYLLKWLDFLIQNT